MDMNVFCAFIGTILCGVNDEHLLTPCSEVERDTRIFLHMQDVVHSGRSVVKVCTVDTDVVAIRLALFIGPPASPKGPMNSGPSVSPSVTHFSQ